jgi:outer membrane biosynthesis protein TonB
MWAAILRHPIAALLSLALHAGLLFVISTKLDFSSEDKQPIWIDLQNLVEQKAVAETPSEKPADAPTKPSEEPPKDKARPIEALALDADAIDREIVRIQQAAAAKKAAEEARIAQLKKAESDLVNTRQVEQANLAKLNKEKALAEQQKQVAAAERAKEEALLAQAARNKEIVEEETRMQKLQAEAEAAKQKAEQARLAKLRADQLDKLRNEYYKQIQADVRAQWRRPLNTKSDWTAQIEVTQNRNGDVQGVVVRNNTGTKAFEDTVKQAVIKANPLPKSPTPDLFEPRIIFTFKADN